MSATKTALVTAAGGGLGNAITQHLLGQGYQVIAQHRSPSAALDALASAHPNAVVQMQANLRDLADRSEFVAAVTERASAIDLLINNLGVYPEKTILEISPEEFEEVFLLTCSAGFHLTQGLLPLLRSGNGKCIINIGDSGADRIEARVLATPYHVAKLGVHVLTRSFAKALGAEGIRVNMISPGFLENSVGAAGTIPLGRKGTFADVVGALDFLLGEKSAYISGTNVLVNGGWNLG